MEKFGTEPGGNCKEELKRVITLFMMKNAATSKVSSARFIQRMTNDRTILKGTSEHLTPLFNLQSLNQQGYVLKDVRNAKTISNNVLSRGLTKAKLFFKGESQDFVNAKWATVEMINAEGKIKTFSAPVFDQTAIGGTYDATFQELPQYLMRESRQKLFHFALQLPYWQGVILYLLSVAYPFVALVVLIPNRARSILMLPLFWFWVKSWDIGLAGVMVFERILWNITPQMPISQRLKTGNLNDIAFYEVVAEPLIKGNVWSMNMNYNLIGIATLAIPSVTGYAILKSKSLVLSSFSNPVGQSSKASGLMAAQAWSVGRATENQQANKDLGALGGAHYMFNSQAVTTSGGGKANPGGGGGAGGAGNNAGGNDGAQAIGGVRGSIGNSELHAKMKFGAKVVGANYKGIDSTNAAQKIGGVLANAQSASLATQRKLMAANIAYDRAMIEYNHPIYGRWGDGPRMHLEAWAIAADKSGGAEMGDDKVNPTKAMVNRFLVSFESLLDTAIEVGEAGVSKKGVLLGLTGLVADQAGVTKQDVGNLEKLATDHLREIHLIGEADPNKPNSNVSLTDHAATTLGFLEAISFGKPTGKLGEDMKTQGLMAPLLGVTDRAIDNWANERSLNTLVHSNDFDYHGNLIAGGPAHFTSTFDSMIRPYDPNYMNFEGIRNEYTPNTTGRYDIIEDPRFQMPFFTSGIPKEAPELKSAEKILGEFLEFSRVFVIDTNNHAAHNNFGEKDGSYDTWAAGFNATFHKEFTANVMLPQRHNGEDDQDYTKRAREEIVGKLKQFTSNPDYVKSGMIQLPAVEVGKMNEWLEDRSSKILNAALMDREKTRANAEKRQITRDPAEAMVEWFIHKGNLTPPEKE